MGFTRGLAGVHASDSTTLGKNFGLRFSGGWTSGLSGGFENEVATVAEGDFPGLP